MSYAIPRDGYEEDDYEDYSEQEPVPEYPPMQSPSPNASGGGYQGDPNYPSAVDDFLKNTSAATGASVEADDRRRMLEIYESYKKGNTTLEQLNAHNDALTAQYGRRGSNTPGGSSGGDSDSGTTRRSTSGSSGAQAYSGGGYIPGDPGVYGNSPMQQVGADPLSTSITDNIMAILNGKGALDEDAMTQRFEKQREWLDKARRAQQNSARGTLADRNLLGVPGIRQGMETGAMERIEEDLAPIFAGSIRDILISEEENADNRLLGALGLGNQRQGMLSEIALGSLDRNIAWNMFLAQHGLERSKVMYELSNGNVDALMPLIQAFIAQTQISAGGYQGDED